MTKRLILAAALLLPFLWPVPAMAEDITYTWDACDTGAPAVNYRMEIEADGATVDQILTGHALPGYTIAVGHDKTVRVRVAGIDAQDRQGVWSEWSEAYTVDEGSPGWSFTCIPVRGG